MYENFVHDEMGCLARRVLASLDQLRGFRGRQFGSPVVDEAGNRIPGGQQLDPATEQHLKPAGRSRKNHQSCPAGVQPESESDGSCHA